MYAEPVAQLHVPFIIWDVIDCTRENNMVYCIMKNTDHETMVLYFIYGFKI